MRTLRPREPKYGADVVAALRFCWAVLGAPTGKRLAPVMGELVPTLRRFGELDVSDEVAAAVVAISPATTDRRLAKARAAMTLRGRSHTKPGSLLKDSIAIRTWAQWDDVVPGFVEIDLVGHEGGNAIGEHAYTLTVTDIATGWTENRSVPKKARKWVVAALEDISRVLPFPLLGIDSDNGSDFINHHLLHWCEQREVTFTRSRPGNSNDGAHVEQENWAVVRTVVGYHRYDTPAELELLNEIWALQSHLTNYFLAQQKLISKVRDGAKITKKYDTPTTPHRRAERHDAATIEDRAIMEDTLAGLNPAAIQRRIQALTAELLTVTTSKALARRRPEIEAPTPRASLVSQRETLRGSSKHARIKRDSTPPSDTVHPTKCTTHTDPHNKPRKNDRITVQETQSRSLQTPHRIEALLLCHFLAMLTEAPSNARSGPR